VRGGWKEIENEMKSLLTIHRRLNIYTKGNGVDSVSLYLQLIDEKIKLPGFSCHALFSLKAVSEVTKSSKQGVGWALGLTI
jgi:hypothetical protein